MHTQEWCSQQWQSKNNVIVAYTILFLSRETGNLWIYRICVDYSILSVFWLIGKSLQWLVELWKTKSNKRGQVLKLTPYTPWFQKSFIKHWTQHYLHINTASVYFVGSDSRDQYWRPNANSKRVCQSVFHWLTALIWSSHASLGENTAIDLSVTTQILHISTSFPLNSPSQLNFWATIYFYDQYFYHSRMNYTFIILTFKYNF